MQRLHVFRERQLALGAALSLLLNVSAFFVLAMALHPLSKEDPEVVPVELVSLPPTVSQAPVTAEREPARPEIAASKPAEEAAAVTPREEPVERNPPTPEEQVAQMAKPAAPEPEASVAELPAELPVPILPPRTAQATPHPKIHVAAVSAEGAAADESTPAPMDAKAPPVQEAAAMPNVAHIDPAAVKAALGKYASRLHGLIEAHKSYPAQALMRREEGTVVLRIVIEHDGKLLDVEALSGPPARLVEASVQATKAAAPFPSLPNEIDLPRATFELPITFRIQ